MKVAFAFVVLCCLALSGCGMWHKASTARAMHRGYEEAAHNAATRWLELLDAGDYEEAYAREPARLRAGGTAAQFVRSMTARRAPFGRTLSRKFVGAAYSQKLAGAPDADYESILFKTSFQHKNVAAERLILVHENDAWKVVDYRLY